MSSSSYDCDADDVLEDGGEFDDYDDGPDDDDGQEPGAEIIEITTDGNDAGVRADAALAARLARSRTHVQDWIRLGRVLSQGKPLRCSEKLKAGMAISVSVPPPVPAEPLPDPSIPLDVRYEDEHIIVVNKQRGLTVHPGALEREGTLVNALLAHCRNLSGIRGVERPGIVHRLDKNTSGLIVVAKDDLAHNSLSEQFAARTVLKHYQALVHGVPPQSGVIDKPIGRHRTRRAMMAVRGGGRPSRTDFEVAESFGDYALLNIVLHSGRTHQIRVHMTWLGYPLVGDDVYGKRPNPWGLTGQALHCSKLGFTHPATGERLEFTAEMPQVLQDILNDLRNRVKS